MLSRLNLNHEGESAQYGSIDMKETTYAKTSGDSARLKSNAAASNKSFGYSLVASFSSIPRIISSFPSSVGKILF